MFTELCKQNISWRSLQFILFSEILQTTDRVKSAKSFMIYSTMSTHYGIKMIFLSETIHLMQQQFGK